MTNNQVSNDVTRKHDDIDMIDFIMTSWLSCNYINKVSQVCSCVRGRVPPDSLRKFSGAHRKHIGKEMFAMPDTYEDEAVSCLSAAEAARSSGKGDTAAYLTFRAQVFATLELAHQTYLGRS